MEFGAILVFVSGNPPLEHHVSVGGRHEVRRQGTTVGIRAKRVVSTDCQGPLILRQSPPVPRVPWHRASCTGALLRAAPHAALRTGAPVGVGGPHVAVPYKRARAHVPPTVPRLVRHPPRVPKKE